MILETYEPIEKKKSRLKKYYEKTKKSKGFCETCSDKHYKDWKIGFYVNFFGIVLILLLLSFGFLYILNEDFSYDVNEMVFINYADYYSSDELVNKIVDVCSRNDDILGQVYCVNGLVTLNFNYTEHDDNLIYSPKRTILYGGVCRDYAITYKTIFNGLGINSDYVLEENHIYNVIEKDGFYIEIDQQYIYYSRDEDFKEETIEYFYYDADGNLIE